MIKFCLVLHSIDGSISSLATMENGRMACTVDNLQSTMQDLFFMKDNGERIGVNVCTPVAHLVYVQ